MKISEIAEKSSGLIQQCGEFSGEDAVLASVEYDSRKVCPGSLFVAVKGYESDGHDFVAQAVDNGSIAVVVSRGRENEFSGLAEKGVALFTADDSRRALSRLSSVFFGEPSCALHVDGITGTNGKTSVTYLLESIYENCGIKCGVIGTVNYRWQGKEIPAPNTTPESRDIQELLKQMRDDGVTHVIMEVSSHALELGRVDDIDFDTAVFTNLTGDHLDFHGTMEKYSEAKKRLFTLLHRSGKGAKTAVLNRDDDWGARLAGDLADHDFEIITYGEKEGAHIQAASGSIENRITGLAYILSDRGVRRKVNLFLAGRFQVFNSLAAYSAARAAGIEMADAVKAMEKLVNVPGRLEVVDAGLGFYAVVDYAHTSDALLKLLQSVSGMDHDRIITVFGCGGDRDRTKRPVMGKIAVENSDYAIITSDNPRTEDPDVIIKDIVAGVEKGRYGVEPDREKAICIAVQVARKDDIIVIAGKGHEDYQIIGKTKRHFDDRESALKYMNMRDEN